MPIPDSATPGAAEYSRLRTRWSLIVSLVEITTLALIVYICRTFDTAYKYDPPLWMLLIYYCFMVWLWALAGFIVVILPFNYHLSHGLRRRFGLTDETRWKGLERVANQTCRTTCLLVFPVACLLAVRVLTGRAWFLWVGILFLLWGIYKGWRSHARLPIEGHVAGTEDNDGRLEELRQFARDQGFENVSVRLLKMASTNAEAQALCVDPGRTVSILLTDTLVDNMQGEEIRAVFAHELAHCRPGQRFSRRVWSTVLSLIMLLIAGGLPFLGRGEVSPAEASHAAPSVLLLLVAAGLAMSPLRLSLSRREERRANEAALEMTGDPAAFISAMKKLAAHNRVAGQPGLVEKLLVQSHPSLGEVIEQAQAYAGRNGIELEQGQG